MAKKEKTSSIQIVETAKAPDLTRSKSGIVTIPGVKTDRFTTLIIGTAPLIVHKFSEKQRAAILAKHKGEASEGRERKDPEANFEAARYRLTDGSDGVPAGGLKACIVDGCSKETGVPMTKATGAIRVHADDQATNLVRILTPKPPLMREDIVRNESGVVDIRHRPEFWPWAMRVEIEFLPSVASMRQILQAVAKSGFCVGLCEWRPKSKQSKSGSYGTFRLASAAEVAAFDDDSLFDLLDEQVRDAAE